MKVNRQNPTLRPRSFQSGFTFLESLVVILIIVLMVWIIIPGWKMRGEDRATKGEVEIGIPKQPEEILPDEPDPASGDAGPGATSEDPVSGGSAPVDPPSPVESEAPATPPIGLGVPVAPPDLPSDAVKPENSPVIPSTPPVVADPQIIPSTPPVEVPSAPADDEPSTVIPTSPEIEIPDTPPLTIPAPPPPNP